MFLVDNKISLIYTTPFISSIVSSYTGILLYLNSSSSVISSTTLEIDKFISTAYICVLGIIISDTVLSLNSKTLFIISLSSLSIAPFSSPTSTIILISSSVTVSSSFAETPKILETIFVEKVKNLTNGAVAIDIAFITPIVPNAIFSEFFIAILFGTNSPNINVK